jgi:hypothetical protein
VILASEVANQYKLQGTSQQKNIGKSSSEIFKNKQNEDAY